MKKLLFRKSMAIAILFSVMQNVLYASIWLKEKKDKDASCCSGVTEKKSWV